MPEPASLLLFLTLLSLLTVGLLAFSLWRGRDSPTTSLLPQLSALEKSLLRIEQALREEIARNRNEALEQARATREELRQTLKLQADSLLQQLAKDTALQHQRLEEFSRQLATLTEKNEQRAEKLRETVESKLSQIQNQNAQKLEEMRQTVDEKLHGALEKRLGESFKIVSERLEQVHHGLGEMLHLAEGVKDLKKVLSNVKTRGTWGEMQLGNLLEQILTPEQYAKNVRTKPGSQEAVEFAIRLPGKEDNDTPVWLPIDAKFPKEDYERLIEAADIGDAKAVEDAAKALENRLRTQARDIRDKYLCPPHTTDFAILYLPTESLYAEVLRRPGLADSLQRDYRVTVTGPTTITALLNSLQMGFRTLAIQRRSSEVWKVLAAVKTEFSKFGTILDKVKHKLEETGRTLDEAAHRSRQIEKKLRNVEALPSPPTPDNSEESSEIQKENTN